MMALVMVVTDRHAFLKEEMTVMAKRAYWLQLWNHFPRPHDESATAIAMSILFCSTDGYSGGGGDALVDDGCCRLSFFSFSFHCCANC